MNNYFHGIKVGRGWASREIDFMPRCRLSSRHSQISPAGTAYHASGVKYFTTLANAEFNSPALPCGNRPAGCVSAEVMRQCHSLSCCRTAELRCAVAGRIVDASRAQRIRHARWRLFGNYYFPFIRTNRHHDILPLMTERFRYCIFSTPMYDAKSR